MVHSRPYAQTLAGCPPFRVWFLKRWAFLCLRLLSLSFDQPLYPGASKRLNPRSQHGTLDPLTAIPIPFPISHLLDRKSTRLNSSHVATSYAVSCLKKKNRTLPTRITSP